MIGQEKHRSITLRFLAEPTDINFGGKVHGGAVMKWIDQGGYTCASTWSHEYCVTAYVGGIRFLSPIMIGELVEIRAKIIYTGRTSMHIAIDLYASDPKTDQARKTTHCICVFVAVDENGKPIEVPDWIPQTEEDIFLENYAKTLIDRRKEIDEEMKPFLEN